MRYFFLILDGFCAVTAWICDAVFGPLVPTPPEFGDPYFGVRETDDEPPNPTERPV